LEEPKPDSVAYRKSVESFLHKTAKELLCSEIERKGGFAWKTENSSGFEGLIERPEYRKECVLMEFPTGNGEDNGMYPDEMGVCKSQLKCKGASDGFRFNNGNGYCKCSQCGYIDYSKVIIHDIVVFWKGHIIFAIEVIHKHPPAWRNKVKLNYAVFVIKADNILKRVTDSPVYVTDIITHNNVILDIIGDRI